MEGDASLGSINYINVFCIVYYLSIKGYGENLNYLN